jgi:hypothetical protein
MLRVAWIAFLGLVLAARGASAQSADAEALFRDGRKLVKQGKLAEGCAKLEASERLESTTGTLLNLGDCREANGQLASAWAAFSKAMAAAKRGNEHKREVEARRRAEALEPRLGHLAIMVEHRVDGMQVERAGQPVDPELWSTGEPLDAGDYEIKVSAPGHTSWTGTVVVRDGARATIEVPSLAREAAPPPAATAVVSAQANPPQPEARPAMLTTTRELAIAAGAVGIGVIVTGAVFGGKARDYQHQADAICPAAACASEHAIELNHNAQTDANIANIGLAIGGAVVAGGILLWVVGGPHASHETLAITTTPRGNGLAIEGSF